ncbi:MAG: hypothetical protein AAGG01_17885 [Planctomycetota bacterium]
MHFLILSAVLPLAGSSGLAPRAPLSAVSQESAPSPKEADHARFLALQDESEEAYAAWEVTFSRAYDAWQKALAEGSQEPFDAPPNPMPAYFERFDALASAGHPGAKLWCVAHYHSERTAKEQVADVKARTLALLEHKGADHARLAEVVASHFGRGFLPKNVAANLLMLIEANASDPEARATAAYCKAGFPPPEGLSEERRAERRQNALRGIVDMYGSTEVGKRAKGELFAMEFLQVGMVAPEIEGVDVDGNPMKLTDFRGKVVVLDFWGFW